MNEANNNPGGFSLVEVVVAILVLSFGLLAMAASTGYVATQLRSTTWDTQRNLARQQSSCGRRFSRTSRRTRPDRRLDLTHCAGT
jgi:Tfp pilus assembly protein PilV